MKIKNEEGKVYGRLHVVSLCQDRSRTEARWNCICQCGIHTIVTGHKLRSGHTSSCGCLQIEKKTIHGLHGSKIYSAYISMIARCYNEKTENYCNYGGRGITVCDRWKDSIHDFVADMGHPKEKMSLDRIDVNGNYELGNCRWATSFEQNRNTRANDYITFNGETKCLSEWANILNMPRSTLRNRIYTRKWSVEKSMTIPVRFKSQKIGK